MIALPEYSSFVPYGDVKQLKAAAEYMLTREIDARAMKIQSKYYSKDAMHNV